MRSPESESDGWSSPESRWWKPRLDDLIARGRIADALRWLDRVAANDQMALFGGDASVQAARRLAWLYKVNLLRSLGRHREALAWACLECELYPENVAAQAMREQLRRLLGDQPRHGWGESPGRRSAPEDLWLGVAGMRELKAILERDVVLPLSNPVLYARYKVPLPNGILLYGPPGCGKTFIAQKLGRILGFHFIEVKPSDLGSTYVHGTQLKIGELFHEARKQAPTLIFFDELDALIPVRGGKVGHHYSAEVNEFLTHLNKASEHRVLVVGATNRLESIDSAALRPGRFDKKVLVGPPDLEARKELLRMCLAGRPQSEINFVQLARECSGYTCAELEHVVNEAARRALDRQRPICADDVMGMLAANPPAFAGEDCSESTSGV